MKANVTVTSGVAVGVTKFLFDTRDCTNDSDICTCNFARVWRRARANAYVLWHGLN